MDGNIPSAEDAALAVIVNAGKASTGTVSPTSGDGNQPVAAAPSDGQSGTSITSANSNQGGNTQPASSATDGQAGTTTPAAPGTDPASGEGSNGGATENALDTSEVLGLLGVAPRAPETVESLKEKYEASSRESHRLIESDKAKTDYLASMGLQLVHIGEGQYQLQPTSEYAKQINVDEMVDLSKLIEPLTEDQKEALLVDPDKVFAKVAKGLSKKVALELLAKRPPVKDSGDRAVLTEAQRNDCFNSFVNAKREDGKTPVFPDAGKPEILNLMATLWEEESPVMQSLTSAAMHDQSVYMAAMQLCYYKAAYGISRAKEKVRLAGEQARKIEAENQKGVNLNAGSAGAPAGAATGNAMSAEDAALDAIAKAKPV